MSDKYILDADGKTPKLEPDPMKWVRWLAEANRRVARTQVGVLTVSTVFLGIDHNFRSGGDPLLFETMIFLTPSLTKKRRTLRPSLKDIGYQTRCSTWQQAEAMHKRAVANAKRRKKREEAEK